MSVSPELRDRLALYAFGALDPAEAADVERELVRDPSLERELAPLQDTVHRLASAGPAMAAPKSVLDRLMACLLYTSDAADE